MTEDCKLSKSPLAGEGGRRDFFSKHRPSGPMLSISRFIRLSVCLSVCLSVGSLLRYRLNVFFPPLPEVGCPIFFRDSESLGKRKGKKWSDI